jgi:hypothetical protein
MDWGYASLALAGMLGCIAIAVDRMALAEGFGDFRKAAKLAKVAVVLAVFANAAVWSNWYYAAGQL